MMGELSGWIFVAIWGVITIYMIYLAIKESRFFVVLALFFAFLTGWYAANEILSNTNMFEGVYSWIFRGVALIVLIVCGVKYYFYKKSN